MDNEKKLILIVIGLVIVAVSLISLPGVFHYLGVGTGDQIPRGRIYVDETSYDVPDEPRPEAALPTAEERALLRTERDQEEQQNSVDYIVEEIASGLVVPWSIAFTEEDRMLVTERPGRLRQIIAGVLQEDPVHVFSEVSSDAEEGLMGLAIDPGYKENNYIYLSLAYPDTMTSSLYVKVVRYTDAIDHLEDEKIILDKIPAAKFHAGSRIHFGPDGKLYITTGDATDKNIAQDLSSFGGKILRINADGSIPDDNPFPSNPIWSYGHRNPQGIDWHPLSGHLYATEHGPSIFDGPAGGDELNRILPRGNYGWPLVSHEEEQEGTRSPILLFTPAEAPGSGMFYGGEIFPQFTNQFFFGALKGEGIIRVNISPARPDSVIEYEKLSGVDLGRIREVVEGPDGLIYFSTSNRDGRGNPDVRDDRIFRLRPSE